MNNAAELQVSMEAFRRTRASYAQQEQRIFEQLYPIGALVEFLDGESWVGPAVVVKNRIGPITATHTPNAIVNLVKSGEEIIVKHPEYIRLCADATGALAAAGFGWVTPEALASHVQKCVAKSPKVFVIGFDWAASDK